VKGATMRLWTIHPKYLDARGLVALWREGLLAQAVLRGRTRGYVRHPQLLRFRRCTRPVGALGEYLRAVYAESCARGYRFDAARISPARDARPLTATRGQLSHEWRHLLAKLRARDRARWRRLARVTRPQPHPLFRIVPGGIEDWERVDGK
jgi:hypothetical protein